MKNDMKIVVGIVIAGLVLAALILAIAYGKPSQEFIYLRNIDMMVKNVNESHATLNFIVTVDRSKVVKNATLCIYVYDKITGLLLQRHKVRIPEKQTEGLNEIDVPLSFEKDRSYRLKFEILKNNKIVDTRILSLSGLDTLLPKDKRLKMTLKDVDFQVVGVKDDDVNVRVRFYVQSMEDYDDVTFHIKAIQAESNVLADESWLKMNILKGKTLIIESNLTVPKDYNYAVKLEVWRNGSLLKTWLRYLNLAPTKTVPKEAKEERVKFEVSEFVRTPEPIPYSKTKAPGFEFVTCLMALAIALLCGRAKR